MARYLVKFFKQVMGENGNEVETCQEGFEIDAANPLDAAERGKLKFCDLRRLARWSLHADRVSVSETEFPS